MEKFRKERISITLDWDLIDTIDKNMLRHGENNRSKFIAFALRQIFHDHAKKYLLLQRQLEQQVKKTRFINDELLKEEAFINLEKQESLKPKDL